jgi:hypothetical protein
MPRLDIRDAGLMHRQAQGLHERIDLLTAAELRRGQRLVLHRHFDRIERGQADRKKPAEDDPIVQSFGDAKLQFRCPPRLLWRTR